MVDGFYHIRSACGKGKCVVKIEIAEQNAVLVINVEHSHFVEIVADRKNNFIFEIVCSVERYKVRRTVFDRIMNVRRSANNDNFVITGISPRIRYCGDVFSFSFVNRTYKSFAVYQDADIAAEFYMF